MKIAVFFASLLLAASLAAQTATAPAPSPAQDMAAMRRQHSQDMMAQVQQMRAALGQMKSNAAALKDPAARKQAQLNVDLWEHMVSHLEGMAKMMAERPSAMMDGNAMMGAGKMDCCAGMQDEKSSTSCCGGESGSMACGKMRHDDHAGHDMIHDHDAHHGAPAAPVQPPPAPQPPQ